jgi:hypothetical protein
MKKTAIAIAAVLLLALVLSAAGQAQADVGVQSASRLVGTPGQRVELTVGCGFCFPPCVGEPGHRHLPANRHGACMLGTHGGPPAAFPVWLTPLSHSLKPYECRSATEGCEPGSARPPHLPSFIYLGRAVPVPLGSRADEIPAYRLIFGIPPARPGPYKYVLFCDSCVDGPRGTLIDDRTTMAGRLRVLPSDPPVAVAGEADGAGPWIAGGVLALAAVFGAGLLLRRGKGAGPQPGRAA